MKTYTCPKCGDTRQLKEIMALAGKLGGATKGEKKVRGDKKYYSELGKRSALLRKERLMTVCPICGGFETRIGKILKCHFCQPEYVQTNK